MNLIRALWEKFFLICSSLRDLPPLFFRLALAYGFYVTGTEKLFHIEQTAQWFQSLGFPMPLAQAYMAAGTESLGFVLLFLGLGTRIISIPLMFVMIVAITAVHWDSGFAACQCKPPGGGAPKYGIEIPFYYLLMLFSLVAGGAGRISLDALIERKFRGQPLSGG